MLKIEHHETESGRAYGEPMAELWIELPGGDRMYFSDIVFSERESKAGRQQQIEEAKARIVAGLTALMSANQKFQTSSARV
jgi:hypothetical protein